MCNDMVNETNRQTHTPSQIHTGMWRHHVMHTIHFYTPRFKLMSYIYIVLSTFIYYMRVNKNTYNKHIAKFFNSDFNDEIPTNYVELMVYYVEQLTMY
jgi:hypothetical protein